MTLHILRENKVLRRIFLGCKHSNFENFMVCDFEFKDPNIELGVKVFHKVHRLRTN